MKLRIKANSIRLRFSKTELASLVAGQPLEEAVRFSAQPDGQLIYTLTPARSDSEKVVEFTGSRLSVSLSAEQIATLSGSNEIGIYTSVAIGLDEVLEIMVEKDFACLDGTDEDNRDTFAHPLSGAVC